MYLLTYEKPHRKTQDLVFRLKCNGINPDLVIQKWIDRKNHIPLYPTKLPPFDVSPYDLGLDIYPIDKIPKGSVIIIGGAGILDKKLVENNVIINVHCGWLPTVRGLDALKWAIYYEDPIGCTTHIIDKNCDYGKLIERKKVNLEFTDTLFSIAMKQYELELNMMVDCIKEQKWKNPKEYTEPKMDPNRRMPHIKEMQMIKLLEQRLKNTNE